MFRYNLFLCARRSALVVAMADQAIGGYRRSSALLGRPLIIKVAALSEIPGPAQEIRNRRTNAGRGDGGIQLDLIREDETGEETITIEKITQGNPAPSSVSSTRSSSRARTAGQ